MKEVKAIDVDKIQMNPYQPRHYFNESSIDELAKSIQENGLIQPISVRPKHDGYEVVVGERRLRAIQKLGYPTIEAYVVDEQEAGMMNKALIENVQREDLSPIEEARAYAKILQYQKITQQELSKQIGKSQSTIANKLRLLNLNDSVQDALSSKAITERHARALLALNDEEQDQLLKQILEKDLTVEQTERKANHLHPKKKRKTKGYSRTIQIAINTLKQAYEMITKTGVDAEYNEKDDEEHVTITIKIRK